MSFIKNEVTQNILDRRSIRAYKPQQLTDDQLETLLHCAFHSPSGANGQQWFISVVQDPTVLQKLTDGFKAFVAGSDTFPEAFKPRILASTSCCFHAPTVFFVSFPTNEGSGNAFILSQTVCLAAQSLGLGTCYLGGIMAYLNSEAGRALYADLKVPEGYELAFGIAIGTPDEAPAARPRDLEKFALVK